MQRIYTKVSTNTKTRALFRALDALIPYALCVLMAWLSFFIREIHQYSKVNADVQRGLAMQERVLREVVDAESGHRGYVLLGDPRYLAQYDGAIEDLRRDRLPLIVYLNSHEDLKRYSPHVGQLLDSKLHEMQYVLTVYHKTGSADARALIDTHKGYEITEQFRELLNRMRVESTERLRQSEVF